MRVAVIGVAAGRLLRRCVAPDRTQRRRHRPTSPARRRRRAPAQRQQHAAPSAGDRRRQRGEHAGEARRETARADTEAGRERRRAKNAAPRARRRHVARRRRAPPRHRARATVAVSMTAAIRSKCVDGSRVISAAATIARTCRCNRTARRCAWWRRESVSRSAGEGRRRRGQRFEYSPPGSAGSTFAPRAATAGHGRQERSRIRSLAARSGSGRLITGSSLVCPDGQNPVIQTNRRRRDSPRSV